MPTVRTVTVKTSGGDYTGAIAAEAGEQGDLISLDRQTDIECYSMSDSGSQLWVEGSTTDATRYMRFLTPSGERHAGVWDSGKYNFTGTTTTNAAVRFSDPYVRFEGMQVSAGTNQRQAIQQSDSNATVNNCIFRGGGTNTNTAYSTGYVTGGSNAFINCLFYGNANNGGLRNSGASNVYYNCTFANNGTYGLLSTFGTPTLTNCYSGGNGTDAFDGTMTRTTCAHDTATSFSGSTASIAFTTSNFTNVTAGSEDLHLVSGASSTLHTGGTDLSGTFTDDIDGETRTSWGIGADFYVAPPATGQPSSKRFGGVPFTAQGGNVLGTVRRW